MMVWDKTYSPRSTSSSRAKTGRSLERAEVPVLSQS